MKNYWALITCFKNEWRYIKSFIRYYNDVWGIKNFYINFGYSNKDFLSILEDFQVKIKFIPELKYNGFFYEGKFEENKITFYVYDDEDESTTSKWAYLKHNVLFPLANRYLDTNISKIINIDSDEYLYSPKVDLIKNGGIQKLQFHFVEFIPRSDKLDKKLDFLWSTQGWFTAKKYDDFYFGDNKEFRFNRQNIINPWYHINNLPNWKNNISPTSLKIKSGKENINDIINNGDICYHFSSPEKKSFERKIKNFNKTTTGKFNGGHIPKDFNLSKEDYKNFPSFIDNTIKKYIDEA
jgi:hypothetical protein